MHQNIFFICYGVTDSFFIDNKDRDIGFCQDKDITIWESKILTAISLALSVSQSGDSECECECECVH